MVSDQSPQGKCEWDEMTLHTAFMSGIGFRRDGWMDTLKKWMDGWMDTYMFS